jgi:hypothetical protein
MAKCVTAFWLFGWFLALWVVLFGAFAEMWVLCFDDTPQAESVTSMIADARIPRR